MYRGRGRITRLCCFKFLNFLPPCSQVTLNPLKALLCYTNILVRCMGAELYAREQCSGMQGLEPTSVYHEALESRPKQC